MQGTEDQIWEAALSAAPPETVAGLMEEAKRQVDARKLPRKHMSEAVAKALALGQEFPSLSPKELLVRG